MGLTKSTGNMYEWISHTHSHLGGECPHKCVYCYVDNPRFGRHEKYKGPIRLIEKEFNVQYGRNKTIFIENNNDLFAKEVPSEYISRILEHCNKWPDNIYLLQTKNPSRYLEFADQLPKDVILGTTIETNRDLYGISNAPFPSERIYGMKGWTDKICKIVTIEPILDFDVDILVSWIIDIHPNWINIGADSKNHNLPEPSLEKITNFINKLKIHGFAIRQKRNLNRLKP